MSRARPPSENLHGTWLVLIMASIGMTVIAYNTTAVITIMPNLQSEFDMRPTTLQWVMTIYTVSAAALVPVMGRLGDQVGKMPVYLFGIVVFALGALVVALSGDAFVLLAGRLGQGIGAASLFGTSLAVLSAATPESQRSFVMGFWGAMMALGMSLGPIIGGSFAELISWRGIFVSDLVLSAVCLALAIRVFRAGYVPDTRVAGARFDYWGAVALVLLLGPSAYALTNGESQGWTSAATLVPLAVALAAAIAFWLIERRAPEPLIHLGYFRHPRYLMASAGVLVAGFLLLGFLVYFNLFVQSPDTLALSPVLAGAALLPLTAVMFVLSVSAPRILAPYSFHWPITIGMTCLVVACLLLFGTSSTSTYASIWWKLVILGIGFGLTTPLAAAGRAAAFARGAYRPGLGRDQHLPLFRRLAGRGVLRPGRRADRARPGRSRGRGAAGRRAQPRRPGRVPDPWHAERGAADAVHARPRHRQRAAADAARGAGRHLRCGHADLRSGGAGRRTARRLAAARPGAATAQRRGSRQARPLNRGTTPLAGGLAQIAG